MTIQLTLTIPTLEVSIGGQAVAGTATVVLPVDTAQIITLLQGMGGTPSPAPLPTPAAPVLVVQQPVLAAPEAAPAREPDPVASAPEEVVAQPAPLPTVEIRSRRPGKLSGMTDDELRQAFADAGNGARAARALGVTPGAIIQECRPEIVFGEQVAGPDGLAWLDAVQSDLEGEDYATGAFDLCAAGFGSPQRRQRLYWLAECPRGAVANTTRGKQRWLREPPAGHGSDKFPDRRHGSHGSVSNPWADAEWLEHLDGKFRPVKPGTHPLAYGTASTVGRLRAAGNAVVAQVAAEFVAAYLSIGPGPDARLVLDDYDEAWPGEVV